MVKGKGHSDGTLHFKSTVSHITKTEQKNFFFTNTSLDTPSGKTITFRVNREIVFVEGTVISQKRRNRKFSIFVPKHLLGYSK